jgi:hypothetical protein
MIENVGKAERLNSLVGGGALLAYAWRRGLRSPLAALLALGGAALVFRGASGHCPLYKTLGISTADGAGKTGGTTEAPQGGEPVLERGGRTWPLPEGARPAGSGSSDRDAVEEASNESFPASDAPAFTP